MCKFFSVISDGNGEVKHFTPELIAGIMAKGNPDKVDFNSHSSLMNFLGIKGVNEDRFNKWEYNPEAKTLEVDSLVVDDDREAVKDYCERYFDGKDIGYMRNMFGGNSGDRNSGYWNSGHGNSGNWNSGNWNSGNWNSGDGNSGDGNSGDGNSGDRNSGYWNSGDRNSGNGNSGNWNSGNGNSGHGNSGNWNSGNWNSGDGNSGDGNSGDRNSGDFNSGSVIGSFCSEKAYLLFNKPCTEAEWAASRDIDFSWFTLTEWITSADMTKAEKEAHPFHETTGGYLKTIGYKEAWSKCPKKVLGQIRKLANFDGKLFEEITGIKA